MRRDDTNRVPLKVASAAGFVSGQARRQAALARQQRERQALATGRRQVGVIATATADDIVCQLPDWMVDVPIDLGQNWSVVVRPEGQRCIVVSSHGRTVVRGVGGRCIGQASYRTSLPAEATTLECVLQDRRRLYIMDVLCWKGYDLVNSTREFRQYWMQTQVRESSFCEASVDDDDLELVPVFGARCSPAAVQAAYRGGGDGMLFYHDQSLYRPGSTPLVLVWKDAACSRYWVEGGVADKQQVALHCEPSSGVLFTEDRVVLGVMDRAEVGSDVRRLQKFTIDGVDLSSSVPAVLNLTYLGSSPPSKVVAHTWGKIVFQFGARSGANLVSIESLLGQLVA